MSKPNGICIELTPTQFDYLYEMIMFGYEMEVPEQKDGMCRRMIIWLTTLPTVRVPTYQTMCEEYRTILLVSHGEFITLPQNGAILLQQNLYGDSDN